VYEPTFTGGFGATLGATPAASSAGTPAANTPAVTTPAAGAPAVATPAAGAPTAPAHFGAPQVSSAPAPKPIVMPAPSAAPVPLSATTIAHGQPSAPMPGVPMAMPFQAVLAPNSELGVGVPVAVPPVFISAPLPNQRTEHMPGAGLGLAPAGLSPEAAKIELEAAKIELEAAKAALETAKAELRTAKVAPRLPSLEPDASKVELDAAKTELAAAKAELNAAKTELAGAKAAFEAALVQPKEVGMEASAPQAEMSVSVPAPLLESAPLYEPAPLYESVPLFEPAAAGFSAPSVSVPVPTSIPTSVPVAVPEAAVAALASAPGALSGLVPLPDLEPALAADGSAVASALDAASVPTLAPTVAPSLDAPAIEELETLKSKKKRKPRSHFRKSKKSALPDELEASAQASEMLSPDTLGPDAPFLLDASSAELPAPASASSEESLIEASLPVPPELPEYKETQAGEQDNALSQAFLNLYPTLEQQPQQEQAQEDESTSVLEPVLVGAAAAGVSTAAVDTAVMAGEFAVSDAASAVIPNAIPDPDSSFLFDEMFAQDEVLGAPENLTSSDTTNALPVLGSMSSDAQITAVENVEKVEKKKKETKKTSSRKRAAWFFLELAIAIALAFGFLMLLQTFVIRSYNVPTGSMESTIMTGDRILAEKISYNFGEIRRGDIVVFDDKTQPNRFLVKRVIATEGQIVNLKDGHVVLDDEVLFEPYTKGLPSEPLKDQFEGMPIKYPYTVPEGCIWVMGDNRTNSLDSRYFGPIRTETVHGHVVLTFWPPSNIGFLGDSNS
jgi:signal peptidase I